MGSGDDRTFRADFSGEGVAQLREHVKEKLKEFMGDYTDDTLVEYVIVLLKNGRHKEEARNELDVFLGDDSDSFVSWLWDHLGSNLNLYVQQRENPLDDVITTRPASDEKAGKNDTCQLGSESNKVESDKSRPRHRREWKGLVRDTDQHPPLRSVVVDISHREEVKHKKPGRIKRSISPQPEVQRKRSRHDYQRKMKREDISQATIAAPRRLLQFAVRDAVATSRPSHLATEPSLKRIRSVVSTSLEDSSIEKYLNRKQSVARGPNAIVTAIKAVAEAAKDVTKVRSSANVFDRLGHAANTMDTSALVEESREDIAEDTEDETFVDVMEVPPTYHQRNYTGQYARKLHGNTGMTFDPGSDGGYNDINVVGQEDLGATCTFVGKAGVSPLMVDYSVVNTADGIMPKALKNQDQPTSIRNASRKMMTGSLNVNTWKSPQYQEARKALRVEACESTENSGAVAAKLRMPFLKKNSDPVTVENRSLKPSADTERESQKIQSVPGLYSTGPAPVDTDSRTIFVNNVHFAATKDSLSRHFNKFGEVLKVVILTDAATRQPKGSAYVEFMRKESAERALSLDGTSFMSRILKVVKKGSAPPEPTSVMTWPRVVRGGPFATSRFGRVPFPRGIPSVYRAPQLPIKPGARSMQWKRDAKLTSTENVGTARASNNAMSSMTARSMTYVRAEQKTN
ncbi:PREDICTED: uncharacterized protein LOC109153909 [Ipomoea nil]|uniref:uncharacterized protein LOC109153909 n=1 Tax=Ipomoea nil TaxID=35883 RepID=UPI000900B923|nr:PREDICTED: uncharacterized protein LOC109153909 [Ipomoea nil]